MSIVAYLCPPLPCTWWCTSSSTKIICIVQKLPHTINQKEETEWIWNQIYSRHFGGTFTINLVVPVSLIHVSFLFRVKLEVKQDQNTIYILESSFSLRTGEEKEDPKNEIWKLYVAAYDDVKIAQQCCLLRILCHDTTSIILSAWQHVQQPKDSQADWSERTDSHLCCTLFWV